MNTMENYPGYLSDFWNFNSPLKQRRAHYVLVVEDSEMDYLLLSQIFKTRKPTVVPVHVETVDEAKIVLQKDQNFDLIICDQFLPGTDTGLALWRFCQERYPEIPFMMTSASNLTSFFETMDQNMAPPFLHKPYTPREAWKKVEPFVDDDHTNHHSGDPVSDESKRVIAAVFATGMMVVLLLLFYGSFFSRPKPIHEPIRIDHRIPIPKDMMITPPNTPQFKDVFEIVQRILDQADEILSDVKWTYIQTKIL